jgi:hypothetical protein
VGTGEKARGQGARGKGEEFIPLAGTAPLPSASFQSLINTEKAHFYDFRLSDLLHYLVI